MQQRLRVHVEVARARKLDELVERAIANVAIPFAVFVDCSEPMKGGATAPIGSIKGDKTSTLQDLVQIVTKAK